MTPRHFRTQLGVKRNWEEDASKENKTQMSCKVSLEQFLNVD